MKLDTLTQALRTVFEQFGNVVDVVAKKNFKAKGQAFIVFETHESALAAIDDVQGFELFGKPMRVALARTPSDKTIELQGDGDNLQAHRRHRLAEKGYYSPSVATYSIMLMTYGANRQTKNPRRRTRATTAEDGNSKHNRQ